MPKNEARAKCPMFLLSFLFHSFLALAHFAILKLIMNVDGFSCITVCTLLANAGVLLPYQI